MRKEIQLQGNRHQVISRNHPPYVIAEIGSNHNQDLGLAKEMIHVAAGCGADAVKFQSLNINKMYAKAAQTPELKELYKKINLDETWYTALAEEAKKARVDFSSAPTYLESLPLLEAVDVAFYKVASPQIRTFPSLLKQVAQLGRPIVMSVGYCGYEQIDLAFRICGAAGNDQVVLLHTVSEYPTAYEKVNLNCIPSFARRYDCLTGLSDHTPGIEIPSAAIALGGVMIEKHMTLDRNQQGPDHHFALEPAEFKAMVEAAHHVYQAMGTGVKTVTDHENKIAQMFLVRWHAKEAIQPGELITEEKICWLRSAEGISDEHIELLGTLRATQEIAAGSPILWGNTEGLGGHPQEQFDSVQRESKR